MDWDKQFASIVTETEANLAKVKQRLESARAVTASLTAITPHQNAGSATSVPSVPPPRTMSFSRPEGAGFHVKDELSRMPLTPHPTLADVSKSAATSSGSTPSWVLLLEDKISRQNKMIEELVQTVHELQAEKKEYWTQVKDLRESIATLHERIVERGVDLHTEAKMEQWRQMTEHELASLRRHVHQSALAASRDQENGSSAVLRQMQDLKLHMRENKNLLRDEYDNVKKELEHMKGKLITIEHTIAVINQETLSFTQRQGTLHDNLAELADSARSNYKELATLLKEKTHEISAQKEEIRDLKKKLHGLPACDAKKRLAIGRATSQDNKTPSSNDGASMLRRKPESTVLSAALNRSLASSSSGSVGRGHHKADTGRHSSARRPQPDRSEHSVSDSSLSMGYVARTKNSIDDAGLCLLRVPRLRHVDSLSYSKPVPFVVLVWLAYALFLWTAYKLVQICWLHATDIWIAFKEATQAFQYRFDEQQKFSLFA